MVIGSKGYIFTLVTGLMVLITLSLILFYTQISSPTFEDSSNRMSLNELHYYTETLKKDAARAASIAAQRGASYAIDHVITTNETYRDYAMRNCTEYNHYTTGVEAALAELILCGTLGNAKEPTGKIDKYMENNTLSHWLAEVNKNPQPGVPYNVSVRLRNMTLALYDPWHFMVVSEFDYTVEERKGGNSYRGNRIPVVSVVDITTMEDPAQYLHYNTTAALRLFRGCEMKWPVNGSTLDEWVDAGCYLPSDSRYNGPSFFDRLEGNDYLDPKFTERSKDIIGGLGYTPGDIGLESLVDLDLLERYNVTVNGNLSQVDYLYWGGVESLCTVVGMERHPDFRVDIVHAQKYSVVGLTCNVEVTGGDGTYQFSPDSLTVPVDTTILFLERGQARHELYIIPPIDATDQTIPSGRALSVRFNVTGNYYIACADHGEAMLLRVTDTSI